MKRGTRILLVVVGALALALVAARVLLTAALEKKLLARPPPRPAEPFEPDPAIVFEQLVIDRGDARLAARWARPADGAPRASVFIAHGGQPERIDDWRAAQQRLALHGIESFAFDYAGFGESIGVATIESMPLDTRAAWRTFAAQVPPARPVFLLGLSGGCSELLSTLDAFAGRPRGIVLISCFSSVRDYLDDTRRLPAPLNRLVADVFDNRALARQLRLPLLQLHGDADRVVPLARAQQLHDAFPGEKSLVVVPGARHNDAFENPGDAIWSPIFAFIDARSR
jgi:alpha-beta hydrolase superfamily lysophospholipase